MTITVELPENKKEAAFVLQLLQKLNIAFKKEEENPVEELPDELIQTLEERLIEMEQNPDTDISMEEFEKKYYQTTKL